MEFLNREAELGRLDRLASIGGLGVVYGRRRIGKTRLLVEWVRQHAGLYTVADQSAADVQRRYMAESIGSRLPGFADAEYRDWSGLLGRLARDAKSAAFRGPLVLDELPYLVTVSPELPSVLQRFIDHEAGDAGLTVVVAGSSQRMMQGLVLAADAPLFGRAREILHIAPLEANLMRLGLKLETSPDIVEAFAAWGGVPRYWELAAELDGSLVDRIDSLVLDPLGPLHREPDHLLIEELPSAIELRPILDAIGSGAHRLSEIAGRIGRPATSLGRSLDRLREMGLVTREVPFGELERRSKRSLYRIEDPFVRMWFRVVAPRRAMLATARSSVRRQALARLWKQLLGEAWEQICRARIGALDDRSSLGRQGPWGPATRWWHGNAPEWDVVAESVDERRLLVGETRWQQRTLGKRALQQAVREVASRALPAVRQRDSSGLEVVRAVFIAERPDGSASIIDGVHVVTAADLLGSPSPQRR